MQDIDINQATTIVGGYTCYGLDVSIGGGHHICLGWGEN